MNNASTSKNKQTGDGSGVDKFFIDLVNGKVGK